MLLVPVIVHSSEAISAAATAPRHGKRVTDQLAVQPCLDYSVQVAGHKRNHPYAMARDQAVQGPGNRAADQGDDAQLGQAQGTVHRQVVKLNLPHLSDCSPGSGLKDTHHPRHVKDRRDTMVP